jgi:hypothetical protein
MNHSERQSAFRNPEIKKPAKLYLRGPLYLFDCTIHS